VEQVLVQGVTSAPLLALQVAETATDDGRQSECMAVLSFFAGQRHALLLDGRSLFSACSLLLLAGFCVSAQGSWHCCVHAALWHLVDSLPYKGAAGCSYCSSRTTILFTIRLSLASVVSWFPFANCSERLHTSVLLCA
jgi:hypothetical protein